MKRIYLSILAVSFGSFAMAQGFYTSVNAGYGFGAPKQDMGINQTFTATGDQTVSNNYGSLGAGLNFGATPGFMFTEHVGAELGLNYFMGSSFVSNHVTTPTGEATYSSKSSQFRLLPAIVISSGGDGLQVYGKAGLVLPVSGSTVTTLEDNTNPSFVEKGTFETKGAMSLGYMGSLGVSFGLSDKLSLFGELNGVNLRIKSASQTITEYTVAGVDQLANMDKYDKETTYVEELTPSSNNGWTNNTSVDVNKAKDDLSSNVNFSALFINVGVKINF